MRLITTKTVIAIGFMVTFLPQMASATASPSFSCSANLVISLDNGYQANCDGDFTFTEGLLENDRSISLTAYGLLNIGENASLSAPMISLFSKNIVVSGVLNAPNGQVVLSSAESTVLENVAQINIIGNPINQITPKSIVNWEQFQITPGASIEVGSSPNTSGVALNQIGGSIVLSPISGELTVNADNTNISNLFVTQVPEPSTYAMMIMGLLSLRLMRKRDIH